MEAGYLNVPKLIAILPLHMTINNQIEYANDIPYLIYGTLVIPILSLVLNV